MLQEEVFFDLSLLSYFNSYGTGIRVADMIRRILADTSLVEDYGHLADFRLNLALLKSISLEHYETMHVREYFDDNANSGVVYYIFETDEELIFAFRGSEAFDDIRHETGWQDWMDNFRMFLKEPTYQQIFTLHCLHTTQITKPFYLCGHSKGGNLALYCALTMRQDLQELLLGVVSFNAPGITKDIFNLYQERIEDSEFQRKLLIFENENDCISSFFEHMKEPYYIRSTFPCGTMEELYHNHNLYAMQEFRHNAFLLAEKKTAVPKVVYHFVNDFFVNLKEERLQKLVARMDDYFESGLSMSELYRVLIYHISKYTSLFEDIDYEEIKTITFQDLIERRKTKQLLEKVKGIQPKDALRKAYDVVGNLSAINKLNELDVSQITQGFIHNYELLMNKTTQNLQELLTQNNERILQAMRSIRYRSAQEIKEQNEKEEDLQSD